MVTFTNLYNSVDLPGEKLCKCEKIYRNFLIKAITKTQGCSKIIIAIGLIFLTAIVYPLALISAGIGLLAKLSGISALKAHNEQQKKWIASLGTSEKEYEENIGVHKHAPELMKDTLYFGPTHIPEIYKAMDQLTNKLIKIFGFEVSSGKDGTIKNSATVYYWKSKTS